MVDGPDDSEKGELTSRPPSKEDLISLCRNLAEHRCRSPLQTLISFIA